MTGSSLVHDMLIAQNLIDEHLALSRKVGCNVAEQAFLTRDVYPEDVVRSFIDDLSRHIWEFYAQPDRDPDTFTPVFVRTMVSEAYDACRARVVELLASPESGERH